jgi:hypothetical protein
MVGFNGDMYTGFTLRTLRIKDDIAQWAPGRRCSTISFRKKKPKPN